MKKHICHWKSIFTLSILFLVAMLFQVLKSDFMALPDSGFSRGLLLDQIKVAEGYDNYYLDHFSTYVYQDKLYLISSDSDGLEIKTFDAKAKLLDSFILPDYKGYSKLKAHFAGNRLILNTFNANNNEFLSLHIDLVQKTAKKEFVSSIEAYREFILAPNFAIYATDQDLKLSTLNHQTIIDHPQYLETLAYATDSLDGSIWIAYTEFVDSQYRLSLKHLDKTYQTIGDYRGFCQLGAGSADKPHELAIHVDGENLQLISVLKNKKAGINTVYLLKTNKNSPKEPTITQFAAFNYSLQPQFYNMNGNLKLIVASKTNIGRVEIGANGSFQNLILLDTDLKEAKALTKSTSPALSPQMNLIGKHNYLCYIQINQGVGKIMLSSDDPDLIDQSLKSSLSENINLLMTTLTTFLPLSYIGLIAEAYVLTPVLIVIVMISMFFLTWAERNGNKLLLASILIHMAAKNYFILKHIIQSPEVFNNFPNFLNSPLKLFMWGALMSISALYCVWDYRRKHTHAHYLHLYFVFNLIDIIFFTMLFTPYYLLV